MLERKVKSNIEETIDEITDKRNTQKDFIYIPVCRFCDSILEVNFDLNNFTIKYECSKKINHKQDKIFFETFDKYYLKKKFINECSKCDLNLENDWEYECKECKNIYCPNCFLSDIHIKTNLDNLKINSKKCLKHRDEIKYFYCTDCRENNCGLCINENCENHDVENILNAIPTINNINSIKNIIATKTEYIENLLISIDEWEKLLTQKIEQLKKNLKKEIIIFEKMFLNHNRHYMNYTYHVNFKNFLCYIKNADNEYLNKFYESISFEEKTKNILELLCANKKKFKQKDGYLKRLLNESGFEKCSKINEKYFCIHSNTNKKFEILWYENNGEEDNNEGFYNYESLEVDFEEEIHSISFSLDKTKIYLCLSNKKIVKILCFDDKNMKLKICKEEIKSELNEQNDHFIKCIELKPDLLAISDDDSIYIWKNNDKKYSKIKEIKLTEDPFDLLLINNKYFVTSLYNSRKIEFYSIENFEKVDQILKIDSIDSDNCLLLYNSEYIIVNCLKGIAIISVETRQLIQYIDNFEGYDNKKICIDNNDNIYIFNSYKNMGIKKFIFEEGDFNQIEEYKNIKFEKENEKTNEQKELDLFCLNDDDNIIIWGGESAYVLKDK